MNPVVAAVTVNFGEPRDTLECVQSLSEAGYPDLRIVVVDNGSPAPERKRLQDALPAGVELIRSDRNLGFSGGNNLGIGRALEAGAEYILLLNNDATVVPGAVPPLIRAVELPGVGVAGGKVLIAPAAPGDVRIWSGGGHWSPLRATAYPVGIGERDTGQYDGARDVEYLNGCFLLLPARTLKTVGLLPEEFFLYAEDVDYCRRVRRAGLRIRYEPRAVAHHKVSRSHWSDRERPAPLLNYYTNRNRFVIARRWLRPWERLAFYLYFIPSRVVLAVLRLDRSYLAGIRDGVLGRTGPAPTPRT